MAATYYSLHAHIVFATADRAPTIGDSWMPDLHAYVGGTLHGLGVMPLAIGGVADHVHLLVGLKTTHAVADVVREVKKASTAFGRQHWYKFGWQGGYGAFAVAVGDIPGVRLYIANQKEHHRTVSSEDELRAILLEHGIEVDESHFE